MRIRILLVFLFFLIGFGILFFRLFYWQIIRHDEIKELYFKQSSESLTTEARRGEIFSSDKYSLATNKLSYLLFANPKLIEDKSFYVKKLAEFLDTDTASISGLLDTDLYWVKIKNNVDVEKKLQIDSLKLPGLGFQELNQRYYPEGSMSAHILGFVGRDQDDQSKGYFGIEGYYDSQLRGRDGKLHIIHDAFGNTILNDIREEEKVDGRSVLLSIDRTIQYIAEKNLKIGIEKYQAVGGSVIVMEPSSGKILAMSSLPKFNPQKYYEFDSSTFKNPVVSNVFEPGSTFKVLIMASGIDKGVIKPDTKCNICGGPIQVGEYSIKTWNNKYYPNSSMVDVIIHSDNTGMVFVGKKLGLNTMLDYLKRFGISEPTGIDLQGEISSDIKKESEWYPIDVATVSFGQGIGVTPIQLLTAVNAIANGGEIMTPYVISEIITPDGKTITISPKVRKRAISKTTSAILKEMMVVAVEKGEAQWTRIKNYKIAGKTGTAQIPIAGHYDPDQTIASFVGFFPSDTPKVSMLIVVDRPKARIYGSETAAPIFFNIAQEIINYYNLSPDY